MKKRTRTLLALGMVAAMLAGCGSQPSVQPSESSDSQATESTQTSQPQESESSENSVEYPEYLNLESARPIVKEGEEVTLKIALCRSGMAETPAEDTWFAKFIEEKLNINLEIEWLTSANSAQRKSLMLASNELPDIAIAIGISKADVLEYGIENEMFLPLSDYASEELTPNLLALWEKYDMYMDTFKAPDGKIYSLPNINADAELKANSHLYCMSIDKKYMDAAGITEIPDTLDGFVDMLRAFKALNPADMGVDEIWPLAGCFEYDKLYFQNAFGWMTSGWNVLTTPCWDVEKGELVIPCLEEKYADYLTLYNTLYTEGLIHPDYFTLDDQSVRAMETEGKVAVSYDSSPSVFAEGDRIFDFVSAYPLASDWNPDHAVTSESASVHGQIYVSANTEYPEVCMRLLDYLCSEEGLVYTAYGAPEGSEDTLGIIDGFVAKESGTGIEYKDWDGYDSEWAYQNNVTCLICPVYHTQDNVINYALEMLGKEPVTEKTYDVTVPLEYFESTKVDSAAKAELITPLPALYMTSEVNEKYTDLKTVLDTYVESESAKFIVGQRPLSELPDFIKELEEMGGNEYRELVLDAYKNYTGPAK